MCEQDVGGLDVAVQQPSVMRVVQRVGDGGEDGEGILLGHSRRVALAQQAIAVRSVDIVHGDPQLSVALAAVMYAHDV